MLYIIDIMEMGQGSQCESFEKNREKCKIVSTQDPLTPDPQGVARTTGEGGEDRAKEGQIVRAGFGQSKGGVREEKDRNRRPT
jgi:hypothetical protein